jgi:hypothetical protein
MQSNLEQKNNARDTTLCYFKTYYDTVVIKIAWCLHKKEHIDQWNRIES